MDFQRKLDNVLDDVCTELDLLFSRMIAEQDKLKRENEQLKKKIEELEKRLDDPPRNY